MPALDGVGLELDFVAEGAVLRLSRRLEAVALGVVQPAVVGTGDAPLFDAAVEEGSAAMGAGVLDKADTAALVPKEDEVLAEDADERGRVLVRDFVDGGNGVPVAAKPLTGGRARSNLGKEIVLFLG